MIMAQYIDKDAVAEIKDLYEDIDKCMGDLVLARSKHDQRGISDAHWKMETLMVNTQQVLSYILQHLEVKEVDFERDLSKYVSNGIHRFFPNVNDDYCKMDSVIWQDYVIETAKYFFNLGLKAQKGKEV